ncbi:MAG: hypothetical protein Q8906_02540 [Bacillota bacterium]|nr:hypothetical protein [Bacillota bacterium]
MVIQANMSSNNIITVWESTKVIFDKFNIPNSDNPLENVVTEENLVILLKELNRFIGSSGVTCIEGG